MCPNLSKLLFWEVLYVCAPWASSNISAIAMDKKIYVAYPEYWQILEIYAVRLDGDWVINNTAHYGSQIITFLV